MRTSLSAAKNPTGVAMADPKTVRLIVQMRDPGDVCCDYAGIHDNCELWNADWQCCGIQHETQDPVQTDESLEASIVLRPQSCKYSEAKP
jgi:hypothetical protein